MSRCAEQLTDSAAGRRLMWVVGCLYVNLSCAPSEAAINQTALDNKRDWPEVFGRFVFIWSWFWRMTWFAYTADAAAQLRCGWRRRLHRSSHSFWRRKNSSYCGSFCFLNAIVLSCLLTSLDEETSYVLTGHLGLYGPTGQCKTADVTIRLVCGSEWAYFVCFWCMTISSTMT